MSKIIFYFFFYIKKKTFIFFSPVSAPSTITFNEVPKAALFPLPLNVFLVISSKTMKISDYFGTIPMKIGLLDRS